MREHHLFLRNLRHSLFDRVLRHESIDHDLVLLADTGFVGEPYLYRIEADALVGRDACQRGGEVFLNVSMAWGAWA